jgi:3-dehydroquinate dehydratase/shikimate dehydrogenase
LTALSDAVEWLEVRADLVGDIDPDWLRSHFKGRLLYALRTDGDALNRLQRLKTAARFYDRIELEAETDLSEELLQIVPAEKRLVSWYGKVNNLLELSDRFAATLVCSRRRLQDCYECNDDCGRISATLVAEVSTTFTDTIAFSNGPLGFWNRSSRCTSVRPRSLGLSQVAHCAAMEPTIGKLIADYGLPEVNPAKELFAIIGNPIFHSLSPRLHNASYRAMDHPALFVPLRVESFAEFWREFVVSRKLDEFGMPINGMTVASPHKEEAVLTAKQVSGNGAAN